MSKFKPILFVPLLIVQAAAMADVSTLARVRASGDITVAPNGDLYISDFGAPNLANGTSVVRVRPDGTQSIFAQNLPQALEGNDFDSGGNLIQAAFGTNQVYRIDPQGNASILATLAGPAGIVVDANDVIYATECRIDAISRIGADGTVIQIAAGGGLDCPNGIEVGHDGALYVANLGGGMYRVGLDGSVTLFATIPGSGNGHLVFVNDHYYVAGRLSHRVYQVDTAGNVSVYAGSGVDGNTDGPNLEATISRPNGIGASPDGRFLYIVGGSDFSAATLAVRRIDLPELAGGFEINAGLAGAWLDSQTPGQGFLFDVIPSSNTFFAAWFTYEVAAAKIGSPDHRWFTAQGPYQDGVADLTITLTEGGVFDDPTMVNNSSAGSATLTFGGCTEATLEYAFDGGGPQGVIALTRLTPDELCNVLAEPSGH